MQKITPFLWFNNNAEEAVKFYTAIFQNSKIKNLTHYGSEGAKVAGMKEGMVMTVSFELDGQEFIALNGGPQFNFSQAISFMINCETQEEIDYFWERLSEGGQVQQCGWLIDKFGLPWQIAPRILGEMMQEKDEKKKEKIMEAMLKMKKIIIKDLKNALL